MDIGQDEARYLLHHPRGRLESIAALPGREGLKELTSYFESGSGKVIGVFTSGGDSQGESVEIFSHTQSIL